MMKQLRKSASGLGVKLLLGFVVVAFVVTGFSSFFTGTTSGTVLSAGDTEISQSDYRLAFRLSENALIQRLQRRPTQEDMQRADLDAQVLLKLTSDAVLDEQGRKLGLGLSEERLARLIADDPSFQDAGGGFSRAAFANIMRDIGMREAEFIRNREKAAVRSQITEAITDGVTSPAVVKTAFGLYNGERRTVEYLTFAPALVEPIADPAADVLAKYFEEHTSRYRAPEYRSVAYAVLTPESISDPAAVTEEQIAADYEKSGARYVTPEKRRVQQIVYADSAAADAAKTALDGGELFEQAVVKSGRSVEDTQLGLLAKSEIPDPAIADAAFALAPNTVSAVVEGAFGPAILRVTEVQPESRRPLEDVRDEIRTALALETAAGATRQVYDAFEDARAGGQTFEEAAKAAGLEVKTIPAISLSGLDASDKPVADLPASQEFLRSVFTTEAETENLPLNLPAGGSLFYEVAKIDQARERTLDEARERVLADWKADETERLLSERIAPLQKRLEGGETIDQIAASEKLEKSTAASISRQTAPGEIGREGAIAAFGGKSGHIAVAPAADGRSKLLLKVTEVATAADPLANVAKEQSDQLDALLRNDFFETYISELEATYPVRRNPQALEQVRTQIR
ncbi:MULTISPECIES: peptidylprolyl isomerase [unclassified Aureimonas]|uniref:peptidylprolyl isomerase n=1 Tax=unclassified Aureimonas TaxID=2615206 RepID=UPI0007001DFF|nr:MULTISPECIES: peptidylprolyl isomerase [unclassified Aureimonas]KQT60328.1 peptidylprolyl isomerase [Aureimonas sp. Leaf427]KQT79204.1 peptidylprolyl isomerase [Aureimonas sp. Leaf460]